MFAVIFAAMLASGCAGAASSDEATQDSARVSACVSRAPGAACEVDRDDDIDEVDARFGVCAADDDAGAMKCRLDPAVLVPPGGATRGR